MSSDLHRRASTFDYDADERWLIENDGFGASQIVAKDVTPTDGARLVQLLGLVDSERLADAIHTNICGPFATIDPQQCVGGRQRDVRVAEAILAYLAAEPVR